MGEAGTSGRKEDVAPQMPRSGGKAAIGCRQMSGRLIAEAVEKVFRGLRDATLIRAASRYGKIDSPASRFGFNGCADVVAGGLFQQPQPQPVIEAWLRNGAFGERDRACDHQRSPKAGPL